MQVEQYRQEVEGLKETVEEVQDKLSNHINFQEDYTVFIGDSFATTYQNVTVPLFTLVAQYLNIPEGKYAVFAKGGVGYNTKCDYPLMQYLPEWINSNQEFWQKATNVILALGTNDYQWPIDGTDAGIKQFINFMKGFPNKRVIQLNTMFSLWQTTNVSTIDTFETTFQKTF